MNAKMSVFVICVEPIIYLSLYNLHDCTFKEKELLHIFLQHDFISKLYETKKLVTQMTSNFLQERRWFCLNLKTQSGVF